MSIPPDIVIASYLLIKEHGDNAREYATTRLWNAKDDDKKRVWKDILACIDQVDEKIQEIEKMPF